MFKIIKNLVKIGFAGIVAVFLLSFFTIIYCNSGVHVANSSGATDYRWERNQLKTNMTEGISWLRMDESGYNNASETNAPISMLLMGSSHMEAANVNAHQNVGYLLNELLPIRTYNIGISGHQIYHCVRNMADAVAEYAPSDYVILETDRIMLDMDSMQQVLDHTYPYIPSYDSGMFYYAQKYVPAIKHLYKKIDDWRSMTTSVPEDDKEDSEGMHTEPVTESYKIMLNMFLAKAANAANGAQLIIFYHPATRIDEAGDMINQTDSDALSSFKAACESNGIIFVDMTESFEDFYRNEHVLAHGFINTSIGTGHLNEAGHALIAEKLAEVIKEDQK